MKNKYFNEMRQFCADVKQFSDHYDLLSMGRLIREKDVRDKLLQCEEKEQQLIKG